MSTTGSFLQANGSALTTINVTVANPGDLCVMCVAVSTAGTSASGMSGTNSMGAFSSSAVITDSSVGASLRLFYAKAGAAGTSTLTATFSGTLSGNTVQYDGWMFTAGLGGTTVWAVDGTQIGTRLTTASTTMLYPSLVAAGSGELYAGCAVATATGSAGSTSGFTYNVDSGFTNVFCRNTNGSGTLAPTATDSGAGNAIAAAALFTATAPPSIPLSFMSQYGSYH